ncbi:hypothetical protein BD410DRAFT_788415 [Rickenella mellea]|uniref:F-box domain-containing protein n=1 Tax=Rickenella mellea TaxID=50990 RepID=A0A4Y7Q5L3_9AGAM|nr:hypothetical protein BD410DRAFT_788415 [Rickenella mellea]
MAGISRLAMDDITVAAIDVEIHAMEQSLATLKSRRNSFCSVNKLPPEIITCIFLRLQMRESSLWLHITHVCRRWRHIALDSPSLWTSISLSQYRPNELAAFLKRSKCSPLTVSLRASSKTDNQVIVTLLCENLPRIREIHLIDEDRSWAESLDLDTIFSTPSPCLEQLDVAFSYKRNLPTFTFGSNYPALKRLKVDRHPLQWNPSSIGGLQELVLKDIRAEHQPNLSQMVSILEACPALEMLSLEYSGPTLKTKEVPQTTRRLYFPHLRKLRVNSSAYACAALLSHMTVSNATSWEITCDDDALEPLDIVPRSDHTDLICKELEISFRGPFTMFEAAVHRAGEKGNHIHTKLSFHSRFSEDLWFDFYSMTLENTCWSRADMLTLRLDKSPQHKQSQWSSFFRSFTHLHTLNICRDDGTFTNDMPFLQFLLDSPQSCVWPNFSNLYLRGFNNGPDSVFGLQGPRASKPTGLMKGVRFLADLFQSRHEQHRRLKELELRNCDGITRQVVIVFRKWVDEVIVHSRGPGETFADDESSEESEFYDDGDREAGGGESSDYANSDESYDARFPWRRWRSKS